MRTSVNSSNEQVSVSNIYWSMLKDLSAEVKLDLIAKLSVSLLPQEQPSEITNWVEQFAGGWKDERTAEKIIDDIYSARTPNREIEL